MRKCIKQFIIFMACILALKSYGQQEYMLTQYMYNGLALNPAYAGIHEGISLSGLWREQWTAIDGAPSTQFASIHSPLSQKSASVGALFYRDVLGVKTEFTSYLSYAYRIQLTSEIKLSMGLQFNIHHYTNDVGRLESQVGLVQRTTPDDPVYQAFLNENLGIRWNFGSGLMLHSDKFYLGISLPQILNRNFYSDVPQTVQNSRYVRHMFITAGYAVKVGSDMILKPNLLVKAVESAPTEFDMNLNALVARVLWLGVSLRSELSKGTGKKAGPLESISGLVAFQLTPSFQIGYAYDFTTTSINTNTHEVMVNYIIALPAKKILTPRYF